MKPYYTENFIPGESLPEVHLSKIFKISRGTIPEALRNLQEEGIVQIIAHRGAIVTELSAKKAEEIYTLRAQLEPYAVRLTMEKFGFSALDIHKLQSIVEELGELQQGDDPYAVVSIDMKFHRFVSIVANINCYCRFLQPSIVDAAIHIKYQNISIRLDQK